MGVFLANPVVKTVLIRTAKNIIILGATATVAFFSNSIFKTQANNALQSFMEDYANVRNMVRS